MRTMAFACLALLASVAPVRAQNTAPSSWGVVGSVVPRWKVPPSLEVLAGLHFSDDEAEIEDQNLKGSEFSIGIARGRMASGDWGVSYVRRSYVDTDIDGYRSPGCQGGSQPGGPFVLQCEETWTDLSRRSTVLNGLEVHKYIPFVTIKDRVQVGVNVGGGFGMISGQVDTASFKSTYTCTFPPGVLPAYFNPSFEFTDDFDQCAGSTVSGRTTVQTGSTSEDISRLLVSETSKMLPLGRVELAGAVLIGPRLKVRVGGGFSHPGINIVSVTGVYFFGN